MKTIWKFPLKATGELQSIKMPIDAEVISAQVQHGGIYIWAIVDLDQPGEDRFFHIVGTGHSFDTRGLRFIDTVQMNGGLYIFHVFEMIDGNT